MWNFPLFRRLDRVIELLGPKSDVMHYARIGSISVGWASLEKSLDLVNEFVLRVAGGEAIRVDIPISLKDKLAFFKRAHNQLPLLAPVAAEGAALAARVVALKDKRHDCIHGFAVVATEDGTRHIRRVTYEGSTTGEKVTPYTIAEMEDLNREIAQLAWDIVSHAKAIAECLPGGHHVDDPLGERPVG